MRPLPLITVMCLALAGCQSGGAEGRLDPYFTRSVNDYFYGNSNPYDKDPDFLYGNDIDGAG